MGRIASRPPWLKPGLLTIVVLLVASSSLASPADEPKAKPNETVEKKAKKGEKTEDTAKIDEAAKRKDQVFKVAEAYLVLLDKGEYGKGWESMTAEVRKGITRRKWVDLLGKTRTPYGKVRGRKLKKIDMRATEVVEQFDEAWVYTDLRTVDGVASSELIILSLEKGKDWVVGSYYIGDPDSFPKPPAEEKEEEPKPAKK